MPLLPPSLELQLVDQLVKAFNESEFTEVCIELGLDYENLGGQGKRGKIRDCVNHLKRRQSISEILKIVIRERQKIDWSVYQDLVDEQ